MKTIRQKFIALLTITLAIQLVNPSVFSQVPGKMSYQAVIRNNSGELVVDKNVGIRIQIKKGNQFGAAEYVETHIVKTNVNGLVSIEIGGGTIVTGSFVNIDWANGPYFLQTETDPSGGANYSIVGISQLLAVPYALYAKTAENIKGGISETDPVFGISAANDITESDIANWNNKPDSYTETDPVFRTSAAKGITAADTIKWNNKLGVENQNLANVLSKGNNSNGMQIKNIANPTDAQDAATKVYVDELLHQINLLKYIIFNEDSVTDIDGNNYKTVLIGNQVWMAENLKTTHYANGDPIEAGPTVGDYLYDFNSKYWFVYNNDSVNRKIYGLLYTWPAVVNLNTGNTTNPSGIQGICPNGWHVPGNGEWHELADFLGGVAIAGGKLKEPGTELWQSPNAINMPGSGFLALPSGYYYFNGKYHEMFYTYIGNVAAFWSADEINSDNATMLRLQNSNTELLFYHSLKRDANCVRCLKD